LTIQLEEERQRGFTLTVDQILNQKAFWFPELDLFVAAGDPPVSFAEHLASLAPASGNRVLDRVAREPEASYAQFTALWEDMGSPAYTNSHSIAPGHIVGVTWDSALYKFGIDRFAGVRNDYGKLDEFRFGFDMASAGEAWRSQKLHDGLPILTTSFEENGVEIDIEQFAYPLHGPPAERRGDIPMVLLQKVAVRGEQNGTAEIRMRLRRALEEGTALREDDSGPAIVDARTGSTVLAIEGNDLSVASSPRGSNTVITARLKLDADGRGGFFVKLPSPVVPREEAMVLVGLDHAAARSATIQFWTDYLERGAYFRVPDEAVNTLFRANLWHALRLPRRHGGSDSNVQVDLPYSNFAYGQSGTPWPVNQSVYVDYMLYDLRGYHTIAAEELAAIYRNNQEPDGRVGGYANWGVYTPGMLYSVAQHFLLSGDRASFEQLLPASLLAMDWCMGEIQRASGAQSQTPGLVLAPLNDGSSEERAWAFNQAYFVAGMELFGKALRKISHPRAGECHSAAGAMRAAVEREFARATVRAPAVELADGTWVPCVPSDAMESGRLFTVWYPTDVDTGPLHLLRLKAMDPHGVLAGAMLHDHEDNLFIRQWGTINEPVYNMQGTAYLLRDQPRAAIRTFYSTMACAFSHSVFEPVEHRWNWGQYFGPPSTDGSWFELYRNMLIHERDDDTLLLCQAAPRAWQQQAEKIQVRRAPTSFGPLSSAMESHADDGEIHATIHLSDRSSPASLLVRFRHPQARPIRSVSIAGRPWTDFEVGQEWVRIPRPSETSYDIRVRY
jgi:hypothetical protein